MSEIVHPNLYSRDGLGKIRQWNIVQSGAQYVSVSGIVGGQLVTSGVTTAHPNTLRDNYEQADFEIAADYRKKRERGYYDDINNVGDVPFFEPMLAQKYKDFPAGNVFTQPKLDGIRCIAKVDGLWTRKGKPIVSCPHIFEALQPAFIADPSAVFDGELYNHDLKDDFNQITSLVRKSAPLPEDKQHLVQYHIYDDATDPSAAFGARTMALIGKLPWGGTLHYVPTNMAATSQDLDELYAMYTEDGYEGQMVRLDEPYQIGVRSKTLLKRKEFDTEEFPVLRIEEGNGNWAGYAKRVVYELPDGREFGSGLKGNQAYTREVLENAISFVTGTVRFFKRTPDGIPRFPVTIDLHTVTRED